MIAYSILFILTVVGAALMLFNRDTVKAAMSLVLVMICLAANFLLMGQEFVALIQILIYAGAIMVVFLFVIMLLNLREAEDSPAFLRSARLWGGSLAFIFFLTAAWAVKFFYTSSSIVPARAKDEPNDLVSIATASITHWVLPFVLTSVILLVAVIGAIVMARRKDEDGNEIVMDAE